MTSTKSQTNLNHQRNTTKWFEKGHVVAIGINKYKSPIESLNTAVNDAREIAHILKQEHGFEESSLLLDEEATLDKIKKLLDNLKNTVGESDRLIFYFAGHGIALESESKPQGYLIPQDAVDGDNKTYLSMTDLMNALDKVDCRHGLIILDCCYGGAIRWSGPTRQSGRAKTIYPTTLDTYINRQAWHILTSSDEHQEAKDKLLQNQLKNTRDNKEQKHSPFAHHLFKGLKGEADTSPKDDIITIEELSVYLRKVDSEEADPKKRQTPKLLEFPAKHKNGLFVFLLKKLDHIKLPPDPEINEDENPYRGLESYDEEHKDVFFGRTGVIEELRKKVHKSSSRLTVVSGASGSGKSSLVKAGLIPHLNQTVEALEQSQLLIPNEETQDRHKWITRVMLPGDLSDTELDKVLNEIEFDNVLKNNNKQKCLLVIDQLEEIETQFRDEDERENFWKNFFDLLFNDKYKKLHIIVTLRSDFESTISRQFEEKLKKQNKELNWTDTLFYVKPIEKTHHLEEAIANPAKTKAVDFTEKKRGENTLVQQLREEVERMSEALPSLSFALQEIYREFAKRFNEAKKRGEDSPKREITWHDYDQLGGVRGAITRRATEEYERLGIDDKGNKLDDAETDAQKMLKWIMLRMVATTGDRSARRRILMSELKYPEPNNKYVDLIINRFVDARLLTKRGEEEIETKSEKKEKVYVEPSHDALIREWTKIKDDWLNEEFNERQISWLDYLKKVLIGSDYKKTSSSKLKKTKIDLQMQRELTIAANNWWNKKEADGDKKAVGYLWNEDPRLPLLEQILFSSNNWLNQVETDFIQRSEQKQQNDLCRIVSGIISATAAISFLALWTFYNGQQANLRADAARVKNLISDKPLDALSLALKATKHQWSDFVVEVRSSLLSAVETPKERNRVNQNFPVPFVAVSKDGQIVSSTENEIVLWDKEGSGKNELLWKPDSTEETIASLDVCSNNLIFSTNNSNNNNLQVYYSPDLRQNKIEQLSIEKNNSNQNFNQVFTVSSDCEIIAVGNNYQVQLLNKQGQFLGEPFSKNNVTAVAISPDRKYIAMADNDEDTLTDNPDHEIILSLPDYEDSPNNNIEIRQIQSDSKEVSDSNLQPNSESLKSNNSETGPHQSFAQLPSTTKSSQKELKEIYGVNLLSLAPPTSTFDEPSDVTPPTEPLDIPEDIASDPDSSDPSFNHSGGASVIAFSPNSQLLVSGGNDGTVHFWNIGDSKPFSDANLGHDGAVTSVSFSSDGTFIVSGSRDNSLRLWDIQGNQIGQPLQGHESWVRDVTVTSDAKSIISSSNDGTIRLWDVNKENLINLSTQNNKSIQIKEVALSKDGRVVATNAGDPIWNYATLSDSAQDCKRGENKEYRLKLWSEGKFHEPQTQKFHSCEINEIAISDDGQISVSGGADGKIILWDEKGSFIDSPNIPENPENTEVTAIAIASNGQLVVSGTGDGKIQLWEINDKKLKLFQEMQCDDCSERISAIVFSHDGKLIASGSHDNIVRLWNTKGKLIKNFEGHTLPIESIAFSHNGKFIASGSQDNTVRLWKTKTSLGDAIGGLWNKEEHKPKQFVKPLQGHKGWVSAIAFSPDDRFIATGSWDNTVRLWDSFGNLMGSPFRGHTEWISSIRFSSDGKSIISGSADKTIRCWQAGDPKDWLKKAEKQLQDHANFPNLKVFDAIDNHNQRKSLDICQEYNSSISNPSPNSVTNFTTPTIQDFAPALRAIAQDYYTRGKEEADLQYLENFNNILKNTTTDAEKAEAYINRGVIHFRQQEYNLALESYDRAIEFDPRNIDVYINRGIAYSSQEKHQQAIEDYDKAIALAPNNADAYISRGIAYSAQKEHQKAIADYDKAIALAPNNADAYYAKGFTLALQEGSRQEAIKAYQKAAELYQEQGKTEYSQSTENQIEKLK